jgi:membrane peptidoglycan carboxypeptidase
MNRPLARLPLRAISALPPRRWLRWILLVLFLTLVLIVGRIVQLEITTSRLQARYLSDLDRDVTFTMGDGASSSIRFPQGGPYDIRLGYAKLPEIQRRLAQYGYTVTAQARDSERMLKLADLGLFLPYPEKDQAGLTLFDSTGTPLFDTRYPKRVYTNFQQVPPLIVSALLFIEDRDLLDADRPNRNPAIDWGRFGRALYDQAAHVVNHGQGTPGGSTLATQTEKFRHSLGGRTAAAPEKLRQIASASVRAYLGGPQTMPVRQQILIRYLNTVPLAAKPGVGEVEGLGDGLSAWYGRDFDEVNRILSAPASAETLDAQALAFKQVLSLMIAQRGPSRFLRAGNPELEQLTDSYLRLLASNGIISTSLRDTALQLQLLPNHDAPTRPPVSFVSRKAVNSLRTRLQAMLGMPTLYELDHLDMSATATLDDAAQREVSERLAAATTRDGAQAAGLFGFEMLAPGNDPSKIAYSFTLFERRDGANLLRVQTDSVNQPFDINQGARLNLGSTAKLRTVVTYLQIVSELHARYADMTVDALRNVTYDKQDQLTRWAVDYLSHTNDRSLDAMLDAAVERKYSASPGELFFTGGGTQTFANFESSDNSRILTVHRAFQHSVNLVFVRLMRDIVHYEMFQVAGPSSQWLGDPDTRRLLLMRFVDQESTVYLHRFYAKYHGMSADDARALMLQNVRKVPAKIATVLRSTNPNGSQAWFDAQMRAALPSTIVLDDEDLAKLYQKYGVNKFSLNDRGYIAHVHPLALWLLDYLRQYPDASETEVLNASRGARIEAYSWLFKTHHASRQNYRIRHMVELQAYAQIGKRWRALGYPFSALTPSYAAAIGASGDRPASLAQLIGIISDDGRQLPARSVSEIDFASGTPYETHFAHAAAAPQQAVSPDIARVVRGLLHDVVAGGTARRLAQGLPMPDGAPLEVIGKTGTGDQRFNVFAPGGRVIESRKVNRTATFVFAIGDRFFGSLTAYVHEPYAARYDFTSALAVQLLKSMAPALQPVLGIKPKGVVADTVNDSQSVAATAP